MKAKKIAVLARLAVSAAALSCACNAMADDTAMLTLTGVRMADGLNQSRNSGADTIDPACRYSYVVEGEVYGDTGFMAIFFPDPVPLDEFLDMFTPGASDFMVGTVDNPTKTHPLTVFNNVFAGEVVVSGITVTVTVTLDAGIDDQNRLTFSISNVDIDPVVVGSMQFDSGSVTVTHLPCVADFNGSCDVDSDDFIAFLGAFANADESADVDDSGDVDTDDFIEYLIQFAAGCA